jgi:hypothetical protein
VFDAQGFGDAGGGAGEGEEGFAVGIVEDFDISPGDIAAPAGAEDFEDGFFGGEAAGEVGSGEFVGEAVSLLGSGEAAVEKVVLVLGVEARNARDFNDIDAVSDDCHEGIVRPGAWWCKRGGQEVEWVS